LCCVIDAGSCGQLDHLIYPNAEIKLDIFHAVQRVTTKVPKSRKYYLLSSSFINDFKMVLRAEGDSDEDRKMDTHDEAVILRNTEQLQHRWKYVKYESGDAVLNPDVCHEIEKLKVHIEQGC